MRQTLTPSQPLGVSQTGEGRMIRISTILVESALLVGALAGAAQDKPGKDKADPYDAFKSDQALLRKHLIHKAKDGGKDTRASSAEACHAAQRIFSRVSFLFRSRAEVLDLLGDPATISDYGEPAGKDPTSPLVYVFDTGFGGLSYTISFDAQVPPKVDQVRVDSRN